MTDKKAVKFISKVEDIFKGLPHFSKSLIDFLVRITPWGVGLSAIFSLSGAITNLKFAFGMSAVSKVINFYTGVNPLYFFLSAVLQLAMVAIAVKAFNPLRNRMIEGWIYIFWSNAIALLEFALGFIFFGGGGFSLVVGALIGYYILFEIKPSYEVKKKKVEAKKTK